MIIDLVCCVYNENINWIKGEQYKFNNIYVYVKNNSRIESIYNMFHDFDHIQVYTMDNIGSCDHAYLHHLITHYYNLPDKLVFSKGTYNKHYDSDYKYYGSNTIDKYMRHKKGIILCIIILTIICCILYLNKHNTSSICMLICIIILTSGKDVISL